MKQKSRNIQTEGLILGIIVICIFFWLISSVSVLKDALVEYRIAIFVSVLSAGGIFYGYRMRTNALDEKEIIFGMFFLSIFIHGMLIVILPNNIGQHDVHFFGDWEWNDLGSGHFGYIQYLIKYKHLPSFDPRLVWGFYNPPLHHIISAVWMQINHLFGMSWELCVENLQILTLFYSGMTSFVGYRILQEFALKGKALFVTTAVLIFHPIFSILSISVNNDALSTLFSFLTVWFCIRWYKNPRFCRIIAIAFSIGLGMMTKLSVGLIAPAVAFVFLYVFWKNKDRWKQLFLQFAGFGAVCIPLGLAWPIRLKVLFDIPFNYVQPLGTGDMWQYVGDYNLWQRFGVSLFRPILENPWYTGRPSDQYNTWLEMFRTSILDERTFFLENENYQMLASIIVCLALLLGLTATGLFFWTMLKKSTMDVCMKGMLLIGYISLVVSFINFQFGYPYICTENFRYIVPTLLFTLLGMGCWLREKRDEKTVWIMTGVNGFFVVCSIGLVVTYCMLFYQSTVQNL